MPTDGLTDPDEVPEPPAMPVTRRGDLWTLGAAGDAIKPRGHQHGAQLAAPRQGGLEAWPAVILAAGDVGVLGHQGPALGGHEGPDGGLLRLQPEPAVALLGGRDPVERDGVAW